MPKTAENFRALCVGNMGIGLTTGKPLHYKGSVLDYIYPDTGIQGGDISKQDGTGGESIYGGTFPAEKNPKVFSGPGMLTMILEKSNSYGSRFFISFKQSPLLHFWAPYVFGRVIKGLVTVLKIEQAGERVRVQITDCGEISEDYVSDKHQISSVVVRKEESEAKLQKDNDSKKHESSDEDPEATLKNNLLVTNGYDSEVTSENSSSEQKRSNSIVDWPFIVASGSVILAGVGYLHRNL